jgi:hypothetical protein
MVDKLMYNTGVIIANSGKPTNSQRKLPGCHFAHHKSHMNCSGVKDGPPI